MDRVACRVCGVFAVVVVLAGCLAVAAEALASGWSIQQVTDAPDSAQVGRWEPLRVWCDSPSDCIAVEQGIAAEHWNDAAWSLDQPLSTAETVSCIAARGCIAFGAGASPGSGVRWSIPAGMAGSYVSSVSCSSSTACTAIGTEANGPQVIERWNRVEWAIQPTPKVALNAQFNAVSCPSATACFLVGSYRGSDGYRDLAERWSGKKWSVQRSPRLANEHCADLRCNELTSVSCASPLVCIAIGRAAHGSFVERWGGKKWTIQRTPNVGSSLLWDVSCGSATACTAVGVGPNGPLAERWNGARWSIQRTARLALPNGALTDVSCPTPTDCTTVGAQAVAGKVGPQWLAERWTAREVVLGRAPSALAWR
jgi:hypothetical protein